jgi:hypothetical protein
MRASVVIGLSLLACWLVLGAGPAVAADTTPPDLSDNPLGDISKLPGGVKEKPAATEDTPVDLPEPAGTPGKKSSKASDKLPPKDPVAIAFQLPNKNMQLNEKQKKALDDLKAKYESEYRAAVDEVQQSSGGAGQAAALKKAAGIRAKIKAGLKEILAIPVADAAKQTRDDYNRKMDEWRRNGGEQRLRQMQDDARRQQEQWQRQQDDLRRRQQDELRRQQEAARRAKR